MHEEHCWAHTHSLIRCADPPLIIVVVVARPLSCSFPFLRMPSQYYLVTFI
jgi:hypothetical protein